MKYFKYLILIGITCGLTSTVESFEVFYGNIETLGKPNEWRFYFSLAAFGIFFSMFLTLILTLIVLWKRIKPLLWNESDLL